MTYTPDWSSLATHSTVPGWFRDAKFGIYFHWGVYAVPAYGNEHYYYHMHEHPVSKNGTFERHRKIYGDLSEFGYHHFIPQFTGEHFDAKEWADLFQKTGARFAGLVAEHHDGFSMWESKLTPFNAAEMGPRRDVVGELAQAVRRRGMNFITTFHHELNYGYVTPEPGWAAEDPGYSKLYGTTMDHDEWLAMWRDKLIEVIDAYHPDLIYHDAWLAKIPDQYIREYLAHYFTAAEAGGIEVAVTFKNEDLPPGVGIEDIENRLIEEPRDEPYLCDLAIGTTEIYAWGYTEGMVLRTPDEIIFSLLDVVSKNGTMMLNISPMANGTIPDDQRHVLHRIGLWLWSFGECVYGTRPFHKAAEQARTEAGRLLEVRYTQRENTVYAVVTGELPKRDAVVFKALASGPQLPARVISVEALFSRNPVPADFTQSTDGLKVVTPTDRIPSEMASVYRVTMES